MLVSAFGSTLNHISKNIQKKHSTVQPTTFNINSKFQTITYLNLITIYMKLSFRKHYFPFTFIGLVQPKLLSKPS